MEVVSSKTGCKFMDSPNNSNVARVQIYFTIIFLRQVLVEIQKGNLVKFENNQLFCKQWKGNRNSLPNKSIQQETFGLLIPIRRRN